MFLHCFSIRWGLELVPTPGGLPLQLYYAMVLLSYCLKVYSCANTTALQKLRVKQKEALKVHKHEIFFFTFFAETESLWSQGPVTRDF